MKSKLVVSLFAISGALSIGACGGSNTAVDNSMTVDGTNNAQYSTSSVTLPTSQSEFAWDLNGDGVPDDRLGALIAAITSTAAPGSATPQDATNTSVKNGQQLFLMQETSTDATQQSAKNAGVKFWTGAATATPPKYDGTDKFSIASGSTGAQFYGNISGGTFTSENPATVTTPVTTTVGISLVSGPALDLPITAARITFTRGANGELTGGQINGAVKESDLTGTVIPAIANILTTDLKADPTNTEIKMFDTNGDGTITAAEIEANPLISTFLAPDVQLFDSAGNYKPNPANTTKDCLSIGLGFKGVGATVTAD